MTTEQGYQKNKINWAAIAAIGTIFAAIAALLPYCKGSEYKIVARGDYFVFSIPSNLKDGLDKFQTSFSYSEIEKTITTLENEKNEGDSEKKKDPINSDALRCLRPWEIALELSTLNREKYPSTLIADIYNLESYWEFTIQNTGTS